MLVKQLTFLRINFFRSVLIFLCCFFWASGAYAQEQRYQEILLSVVLNQQDFHQTDLFLQTPNGQLLARKATLEEWRVDLSQQNAISYNDKSFYYLNGFRGVTYKIDTQKMKVYIEIPAQEFLTHKFSATNNAPLVDVNTPRRPGAYLNYDVFDQTIPDSSQQVSGLFTATVFNDYGVGSSDFLVQQTRLLDQPVGLSNSDSVQNQALRLDTSWTYDDPAKMRTLRLGDEFTDAGMWGQSVAFGGVQYATNFNTQPNFITFPLPAAKGVAVMPTAVNLYVNNALVEKQPVNPGPFNITNVPVINGYGTVNVVTTDLFGRQQVISLPYYASNELLKPGLQDFSYEAGYLRNDFGVVSNSYQRFAAVGTDAIGITNDFTGQWHAELLRTQQTAGVGADYVLSDWGVINTAIAGSHSIDQPAVNGEGMLAVIGFQRQALRQINFGFNVQATTDKYNEIGYQPDQGQLPPSLQSQVFAGIPLPDGSSVGMSYTKQNNRGGSPNASLYNVSYSRSLGKHWQASLTGITNIGGQDNKIIYLSLTSLIGQSTTASISATGQAANNQGQVELTKNLPVGTGFGYDLQAQQSVQGSNYQLSGSAQNEVGTYNVQVARQSNQNGYRAEASGGIVYFDRDMYLSRQITGSFALVKAMYPKVKVYDFNQEVGETDKDGDLLVPNLIAYQANPIRIDPSNIPLSAKVGTIQIQATPYYQSGVLVKFPVRPANSAIVTVKTPSGDFVPEGSVAVYQKIKEHPEQFPVGSDGELYVTGLTKGAKNPLLVEWDDHRCMINLDYQPTKSPIANLGTVVCSEVTKND